ncbi:hypothetical protein D3C71_2037520 [compost metagenome]
MDAAAQVGVVCGVVDQLVFRPKDLDPMLLVAAFSEQRRIACAIEPQKNRVVADEGAPGRVGPILDI